MISVSIGVGVGVGVGVGDSSSVGLCEISVLSFGTASGGVDEGTSSEIVGVGVTVAPPSVSAKEKKIWQKQKCKN